MNLAQTTTCDAAPPREGAGASGFRAEWARCLADVRAAQRLRYRVFVEEGGAQITSSMRHHELDAFDPWCEHLLVRHPTHGEVIGTYRVLTPEKARLQSGLYADAEFNLSELNPLRPRLVELGRACVHPDHRAGGVILALWRGLTRFMRARGLDTMIGSASVPMRDGGHAAASLWTRLRQTHLAPRSLRVHPWVPLPVERLDTTLKVEPPPLVKGYLRLGGFVGDGAVVDHQFHTTDVCIIVKTDWLSDRYMKHYTRGDQSQRPAGNGPSV